MTTWAIGDIQGCDASFDALLEAIARHCQRIEQTGEDGRSGRVVVLYVPAHRGGVAPNAYADMAAKSHLAGKPSEPELWTERAAVLAMVDEQGRYRWIHRVATARFGTDNEVARLDDGILIAGTRREIQPRIVEWDGEVRWQEPVYMHHDARYLGDRLVYLVHEDTCDWSEKGGSIHERSFETGEVTWQFDLCEHVPPQEMFDWAHVNTVEPTPEGDYLLSVRNMHHVSYIDRDERSVRWRMGYDGDFTLPEGQDWFLRQHAPELQPNGNILIFDNGFADEGRTYSRAVEYAIDTDTMEAEVVWEYRHDPEIFSPIQGDADRLSGGTTLVTFSQRSRTVPTRLVEVDSEGTVVWQLDIGLPWGIYRSDRIEPPPLIFAVE